MSLENQHSAWFLFLVLKNINAASSWTEHTQCSGYILVSKSQIHNSGCIDCKFDSCVCALDWIVKSGLVGLP